VHSKGVNIIQTLSNVQLAAYLSTIRAKTVAWYSYISIFCDDL